MFRYIVKRVLLTLVVMLGVVTVAFILNELTPGDAATIEAGNGATPEQIQALREALGLDRPVLVRYAEYVFNLFTKADFGTSYSTKQPVLNEIMARFPNTIMLAVLGVLLTVCIGVPLGIIAAVKQNTLLDNATVTISLIGVSVPQFWLALLLISVFAVKLNWLPAVGISGPSSWILPAFTLGFGGAATVARTTRSSMLEVIRQDYMQTAKAKGQSAFIVIIGHGLRNALIPIVTVIGNQLGHLLGGATLVESVFGLPGLGKYLIDAVYARNGAAVQGCVVFMALIFSVVNLCVDLLYTAIDPALKTMFKSKHRRPARARRGVTENG